MKYLCLAAALTAVATASEAATLSATSVNPSFITDFTVSFDDTNADGLLQFTEITSFSGLKIFGTTYTVITGAPPVTGFVERGGDCDLGCTFWNFAENGLSVPISAPANNWTYTIDGLDATIPLPATLPLLLAGFGALGVAARRKAA